MSGNAYMGSYALPTADNSISHQSINVIIIIISCRRAAATICPRPFPPSVGAEAPRVAEQTAT